MSVTAEALLSRALALPAAAPLLEVLEQPGLPPLWLVGGAVRDLLLDREPLDLDLMIDGDPADVAGALGGEVSVHGPYLTASVRVGGISYDLARARRERYRSPGALPEVEPASVREDLRRRDFSVNALALALNGPERGTLLSVPDALEDLKQRQLRVLHPGSFQDDPTRLLRLARYAARLDFSVEESTQARCSAALASGALGTVSGVRIGNELRRIAADPDPVRGFVALGALGIDGAIDPALGLVDEGQARRALTLLEPADRADRTVLAAALLGAGRSQAEALLDRLGFIAEDREAVLDAAVNAERVSRRLEYAGPPSEIDWAAGGSSAHPELIALAGAIHPANAAREWLVVLRHQRLSIDGSDLVRAGVAPGPAVGSGLAAARAALLDGEAPDREGQLAVALEAAAAA